MKVFVSIGVFIVLVAIWAPFNSGARVCVIDLRNCRTNTSVCGRFGRSSLCQRFNNLCALQSANCAQSSTYTQVNATFCRGITGNNRGRCNGLSNSNNNNNNNGLLSSLFNFGGSSTTQVRPIIIRT